MLVYISYRGGNRVPVQRLIDSIRRRKYAVAFLDPGAANPDLSQRHEANLRYCDGLVVYYGPEGTGWAEALTLESRMLVRERHRPKKLSVVPEAGSGEDFGIIDDDVIPIRMPPARPIRRARRLPRRYRRGRPCLTQRIPTAAFAKFPRGPIHSTACDDLKSKTARSSSDGTNRRMRCCAGCAAALCGRARSVRLRQIVAHSSRRAGCLASRLHGGRRPLENYYGSAGQRPVGRVEEQAPSASQGRTNRRRDLLTDPSRALDTDSGRIAILVDQFEELFQYPPVRAATATSAYSCSRC